MKKNLTGILVIACAAGLLLASCKGSSKMASNRDENRKKMACGKVHVDMNTPHIDWFEEDPSVLQKADEILVLPKDYKVYSADSARMHGFFAAIDKGEKVETVLPLPHPANCQLFTMQKITPENVSNTNTTFAKGESKGQPAHLHFFAGKMRGNIDWFGLPYEIRPVPANGSVFYVIYTRDTAAINAAKNQPIPQPELIEIRYDK